MKIASIVDRFEMAASLYPNKVAISYFDESLCYEELNKKANQLARFLMCISEKPPGFIPILSGKSINALIAIIAILKIGAAYAPVNPDLPEKAVDSILKDIDVSCVLIASSSKYKFKNQPQFIIDLDNLDEYIAGFSDEKLNEAAYEFEAAYVIYTSGSTGKPKGVIVTHLNLLNTYDSWEKVYELKQTDIHLQMASFSFDVFTGDWVRALCSGGKLVLAPKSFLLQPEKLYHLILKEKINCAEFVPVVLKRLLDFARAHAVTIDQFRLLICGSDQWQMRDYNLAKQVFASTCRIVNSYGLTETTIDSTFFEENSTSLFPENTVVPIGKPFPHVKIYLLDKEGKPIPKENSGEVGEIYIGGSGVAKGYYGQISLEEKFLKDPYSVFEDARMYRTGDFGEYLTDGNIAFLGRNETHLKIDGQRVELLAVETILNEHPKINCSIVSALKYENHTVLKCFILFEQDVISHEELIKHLKKYLPIYSIPKKFYAIENLVLNENGKVSREISVQKIKYEIKPKIVPPSNMVQSQLIDIWKNTLNQIEIGIRDNFYELSGTSLSYVAFLEKASAKFNVDIPCHMKFQTIEHLSIYIAKSFPTKAPKTEEQNS